ncbi:MAG: 1,4-alpha-glucan branching enzyme [Lachnospiraceae bacterium]|nr:1,4-alpha-glucan branching enzyme [Lachnospiraceae bacterium]
MRPEVGRILNKDEVLTLNYGDNSRPNNILGRHVINNGQVISCYHPNAEEAFLEIEDREYPMDCIEKTNIFAVYLPHKFDIPYHIRWIFKDGTESYLRDPYSFALQLDKKMLAQWEQGTWIECYKYLGAHPMIINGISGVHFAVWAPNAKRVSVVGDFNNWDGRVHPMIKRSTGGIFELFIPDATVGMYYKFEIKTQKGDIFMKADPFANQYEVPPKNASVVANINRFVWDDRRWMIERNETNPHKKAIAIYEVHLGSWRRNVEAGNSFLTYKELAYQLQEYVTYMGYTHVQLLGLQEHLREETIGHEVYGFFAPTARHGKGRGLRFLINHLHMNGIGVIVDWMAAGMSNDPSGMTNFDGTHLYETSAPEKNNMMKWDCSAFDFTKKQVRNYILSSAEYWMEELHVDGFRLSAIDSLMFDQYYRANEESRGVLEELQARIREKDNGCFVITERIPKTFKGKFEPTFEWAGNHIGPLVAHIKKDNYAQREEENSKENLFAKMNNSEAHIIKLSHRFDFMGGTLISRLSGDLLTKFANVRMLYGYLLGMRGKKHFFMGQEFAQWNPWNVHGSLDWDILGNDYHKKLHDYCRDILHFYRDHHVLYETDYENDALEWLTKPGEAELVSFMRKNLDTREELIFICNFTPIDYENYTLGLPADHVYQQVLSSDDQKYGGLGLFDNGLVAVEEKENHGFSYQITLDIAKHSLVVLQRRNRKDLKKDEETGLYIL